jgi:hypothetical protein
LEATSHRQFGENRERHDDVEKAAVVGCEKDGAPGRDLDGFGEVRSGDEATKPYHASAMSEEILGLVEVLSIGMGLPCGATGERHVGWCDPDSVVVDFGRGLGA